MQWTAANGGNDHWYTYVDMPSTWHEAADFAAALTLYGQLGYLATITSEAENNFIIDNFNQRGWLGGSDAEVEGDWRWVVGPGAGELFSRESTPTPTAIR